MKTERIWIGLALWAVAVLVAGCGGAGDSVGAQAADAQAADAGPDAATMTSSPADPGAAKTPDRRPAGRGTTPRKVTGAPAIQFERLEHDFGSVYEGDEVRHTFTFTNTGDAPLVISRVKATCGCTVPSKPEEPIPAGGSASIEVAFNTKGKKDHQRKEISVFSNDPELPMLKLAVIANVIRQFWIEPGVSLYLGAVTKSRPLEDKKIVVRWSKDLDLEVTNVASSTPAIRISREPVEDETTRGLELTLDFGDVDELVQATNTAMPRITQYVTIETSDPRFATNRVNIRGNIIPEVTLRPRVLSFGVHSPTSKPVTKKIIVTAARDFELDPPTIESDLAGLTFEVKTVRPKQQYQIEAILDPAAAEPGQFRESVVIQTNSKEFDAIKIPAFGKVREE